MQMNPATITTDKGQTFTVEAINEVGPNVGRYGWTHNLAIRLPRGRKLHHAFATITDGQIVRVSRVTSL